MTLAARPPAPARRALERVQMRGGNLRRRALLLAFPLVTLAYTALVAFLVADPRRVEGLGLFVMALAPALASLYVLTTCALAFPAERQANTLEALVLTPLPAESLILAHLRPRLRLGVFMLLAAAPFYLVPHPSPEAPITHVGVLSTFWRPIIGIMGLGHCIDPPDSGALADLQDISWWPGFLSGPAALFIDATRLYALAALGTAVSVRVRSAARAVLYAMLWAALFLLVTAACEWLGGIVAAFMALGPGGNPVFAGFLLVAAVLLLEAWLCNLVVMRNILRSTCRRAQKWLADAG